MAKFADVLELNGRRYDASTGRLLSSSPKSVDGFLPPAHTSYHEPRHAGIQAAAAKRPTAAPAITTTAQSMDIHRGPAHPAKHHQLQHSRTLMRHAVHKPGATLKRHTTVTVRTGTLAKPASFDIVPKHSVTNIDKERLHRALTIARSGLVRRFAAMEPVQRPGPSYQPRTTPPPITRTAQPITRKESDDIFERALAAANSHTQPYAPVKKSRKHRLRQITSIAASALAILLIVGFVAYQNEATIQLRLASSRAGINATLPAWQPAGFKLGTFAYGPGNVTVKYDDRITGQSFSIAQASSNWDSSTLLSDYVYPNNNTYDTVAANGTTIYTFGNGDATWVNGGIWYKLSATTPLSTTAIVNIATSM